MRALQILGTAVLAVAATAASARITEVTVPKVPKFAEGAAFGTAGAYERVTGIARGELDPGDARNRGIRNLDRAPKNARGMVEYDVDFDLLRPADPAKGNHKILFDINNRGRKFVLTWLMDGSALPQNANNPLTAADAGNAFFLKQGYTIAWTGWDPDAPTTNSGMTIRVPVATDGGKPIVRTIREELVSATRGPGLKDFRLSHVANDCCCRKMRRRMRNGPRVRQ